MTNLVEFLTARLAEDRAWADNPECAEDPARVLREVEAKRQIVELHNPVTLHGGGGSAYYETTRVCRSCEPPKQFPETAYPCATLRLLALPYADHPDYRAEEWKP